MFFKKRNERQQSDMLDALNAIIPDDANLLSFEYSKKIFGNIFVEIEVAQTKHTFVADRGEIYHNGKMLCDSSYRYLEKEDTFLKLLQMIKEELFLNNS